MKKKGISLIVLIITCVVIIILATAIIVNIAQTNMIENAKEAVVKQDFKTMQDELTMYKADKYADTLGDFKAEDLNVTEKTDIAKIIPSIVGSKYENYVVIEKGCIAITDDMPEQERKWAMEALGLIKTSTNRPTQNTTKPTVPTALELTVVENNITAVASGSKDDNGFSYEYSVDGITWQSSGEFKDLESAKEYTVYARAKDNAGNVSEKVEKSITTKYNIVAVNETVVGGNGILTGETPSYNNPVIPVGFKAIETNDATWADANNNEIVDGWKNGLVIQDEEKNEFVWVPCTLEGNDETITQYTRMFSEYPKIDGVTSVADDIESIPVSNETEQISKYGGFYIGRYEAGIPANQTEIDGKSMETSDKTGVPVVKALSTSWTCISYKTARNNAKSLYTGDNVKSGLVTGTQWDTVMKWIEKSGISVTDSTTWGNNNNSVSPANVTGAGTRQKTGFSEYWKAKNIYDLSGNVGEWCGDIDSNVTEYAIERGGSSATSGIVYPASIRNKRTQPNGFYYVGFRIVLYVK